MKKKHIYVFELDQAKKLVPVSGFTSVAIETTGEYEVINCRNTCPRGPRKFTLASTKHGELYRSPMGVNRSVRITLPAELCTRAEVKRQIDLLFDSYLINLI